MHVADYARWMLAQEARALLTRLARVKPFALQEPMLPAAALLPAAQSAIEWFLTSGRRLLFLRIHEFLRWLETTRTGSWDATEAQRRFTILRMRFNAVLQHFDMFDNVISQRSENEVGVWLSGLDVVSADALQIEGGYYQAPAVICYLDRGIGAAIRRARTRMPGGGENPVAIVRVPRERMVGSGIASSLIHEVGHQAASLLGLVESLRPVLAGLRQGSRKDGPAWELWERWISEILADAWSVARLGVGSTMGLIGVVSLPRAFIFRVNFDDPHPSPYIRVKLSAAIGQALYPAPQWSLLTRIWEEYYPIEGLDEERRNLFAQLEQTIPALVTVIVHHRPASLKGRSLMEALDIGERQPSRLRSMLGAWRLDPKRMYQCRPTTVFAAIGQGRADGKLTPEEESTVLGKLLTHWALQSSLTASATCAARARACACVQAA
jgi:hypothetical protein